MSSEKVDHNDVFRIAAIQMVSTPNVSENIETARQLIEDCVEQGAQMVLLPEYWPIFGLKETDKFSYAEDLNQGPIQDFMREISKRLKIWLLGGTIPLIADPIVIDQSSLVEVPEAAIATSCSLPPPKCTKVYNSLLAYDPNGNVLSRYDKIHLFSFQNGVESYDESRTIACGDHVKTVELPFGLVGLSVCYDLRFPELYRLMGPCSLIVVPSAFTYTTGEAHWELLLRARAVENQCYILAAAQGGEHPNGRKTWGQTICIDPWGRILAEKKSPGKGIVVADIDMNVLQEIRLRLPAIHHRKL